MTYFKLIVRSKRRFVILRNIVFLELIFQVRQAFLTKNLVTTVKLGYGLGTHLKILYANICTDVRPSTPPSPCLHKFAF